MLTDRFDGALAYASRIHRAQTRTGTHTPYVAHLMAVASLTLENGGDEDQAIAGLLHDAAEDQGGRARLLDIERLFGARVARIVADCTDTFEDPKPAWLPRKQAYIGRLAKKPSDSLLVSLADKTHNSQSILTDYGAIGPAVWSRFSGGRNGTLWYYQSLAERFLELLPGPLARQLERNIGLVLDLDAANAGDGNAAGLPHTHDVSFTRNGRIETQRLYDSTDEWAEEYAEVLRGLREGEAVITSRAHS